MSEALAAPVVTEDDRYRSAIHEAGHACTAWRLGWTLSEVSLQPDEERWGRVCYAPAAYPLDGKPEDLWLPLRGPLRDQLEDSILVAMAGSAAEEMAGPPTGFRATTPDEEWVAKALAVATRVLEVHAEAIEAGSWMPHDERHVRDHAWLVAGDEAVAYETYLRAVVRRLVYADARLIDLLAEALLAEPSRLLSGERATAIIEGRAP